MDTPPTVASVLRALAVTNPPCRARAGLHLLTPRQVAVGLQARVSDDGTQVSYRGRRLALPAECSAAQAVRAVRAVVAGAHRGPEIYLDLRGEPWTWLKPVRTGAYVVLAGAAELFGGPVVRVDPAAASPQLLGRLAAHVAEGSWWLAGEDTSLRGVRVRVASSTLTVTAA
jgi:hypothetical protein